MPVLGAGSARGRDSGRRRRCCELAVRVVETGCRRWALAVRVVETGCRVLGAGCWCWVLGIPMLGAGAGRRELACRCSVLVPASDSEVITTSAACSSEGRPSAASDNEVPVVMGRVNLFTQHHTVLSLERSLSISALFRSCFGRQLCQGLYCLRAYFCTYTYNVLCATSGSQPAIVSACYTHNSRAGYCLALGERSLRALPFVRILLRA